MVAVEIGLERREFRLRGAHRCLPEMAASAGEGIDRPGRQVTTRAGIADH